MSPELIIEIQARIATLEPIEKELWDHAHHLEHELERVAQPHKKAVNDWYKAKVELDNLRKLLPEQPKAQEKAVPF